MIEIPGAKIRENFGKSNRPTGGWAQKIYYITRGLRPRCNDICVHAECFNFWAQLRRGGEGGGREEEEEEEEGGGARFG